MTSFNSCHKGHCLNLLFTVKLWPSGAMQLSPHGHNYELPAVKFDINKRNFDFIVRDFCLVLLLLCSFFV